MSAKKKAAGMQGMPGKIAKAIDNEPVVIKTVKIDYDSRWDRTKAFIGLLPKTRPVTLHEPCLNTVYRLAATFSSIHIPESDDADFETVLYQLITRNTPKFAKALAIAVHNGKGKPAKWLLDAISYQFNLKELHAALTLVYRGLDTETFFGIMASVRNVKIVGMLESKVHGPSSEAS